MPSTPLLTTATLDAILDEQAAAVLTRLDQLSSDLDGSVHDARVAARKLRSTLVVFRPMLRKSCTQLAADLRWFAGELSQARDAQVVRTRLVAAIRTDDAPAAEQQELVAEFDRRSAPAWVRARASLTDPRTHVLVDRLGKVRQGGSTKPVSHEGALADRTESGLIALLDAAEATIAGPADDERIHALRKQVKRVRFATAAIRGSGAPQISGSGRVIGVLEDLQDVLGEYQDAVVMAAMLESVAVDQGGGEHLLARRLAVRQRAAAAEARQEFPGAVGQLRAALARGDD